MTTASELSDEATAPIRGDTGPSFGGVKLLAAGMLLLQLAWVVAVPPFGGSDEYDHAFKAAAVARGEWIPSPAAATRGTGAWVHVPKDLVTAARPQCQVLRYTHDEDCVGTPEGDSVRIASGAGRYHPVFYALIGLPALPFDGYVALYVMRLATVLLGWLLFCGALAATHTWARSAWPYVALAVASTPVLVYSSSVVAPNGVEMMAAMMFWASLIGLARERVVGESPHDGRLLAMAVISGATLVTTRSLGPLWCGLAVLTVTIMLSPSRRRWVELGRQRTTWLAFGAMAAATLASVWWILAMGPLKLAVPEKPLPSVSLAGRINDVLHDVPVSLLQSIAAFPFRNQPTQPVVYACFLVLFTGWLVLALRAGTWRSRLAVIGTCAVAVVTPVLIQIGTYDEFRSQWQGRYALPYSVGMALVAGAALDRQGRRMPPQIVLAGIMLFTLAQVVGPVDVLRKESRQSPLAGSSSWLQPSPYVVALIALLGAGLMWWGACTSRATERVE